MPVPYSCDNTTGNRCFTLRPANLGPPRQLHREHLGIQEQQRRHGLAMRRCREVALCDEPGEEGLDLRRAHLCRMPQAVIANEAPSSHSRPRASPSAPGFATRSRLIGPLEPSRWATTRSLLRAHDETSLLCEIC